MGTRRNALSVHIRILLACIAISLLISDPGIEAKRKRKKHGKTEQNKEQSAHALEGKHGKSPHGLEGQNVPENMQIKPKGAYILKTYTPKHVLKKIGRTFKVDPKETEAAKKYLKSVVSQLNKVQSLFTKHIKPFVQSATKGHHEGGKHGSRKAAGPGKNDLDQIVSKAKSLLKKGKKVLSNCPCKRLGPHTKVDIEEKVKKAVVKAQTDLVAGVTHLFYFIANANCHAKKQNAPCDAKEVERAAESLPKDLQLPLASPEEIKKMNEKDGIRMPKHGKGKHGKANAETGAKKEHKHGHTHGKGNSGAAAEMGAKESHKHGHKHGHHGKGSK